MCRYVFPRTIWRVPYLSSNQKLLQMQEYTHVPMQLGTGSLPYVPYNATMPHACEQVLNTCPIETMKKEREGIVNRLSSIAQEG